MVGGHVTSRLATDALYEDIIPAATDAQHEDGIPAATDAQHDDVIPRYDRRAT